jgi:hypothetical protein
MVRSWVGYGHGMGKVWAGYGQGSGSCFARPRKLFDYTQAHQ